MAKTLPLAAGERVIWSSPPGRSIYLRPGGDPRFVIGMFFVAFYAMGMVIALGVVAGARAVAPTVLAPLLAWLGWRRYQARPAYFLSTHRLYHRGLFGLTVLPLAGITRCRRHLLRVRTRYGS